MAGLKGNCCVIRGGEVSIAAYVPPVIVSSRPRYPHKMRDLGEVSMAEINIDSEDKERMSHRNPAGGLSCSFSRIKKATLKLKADCADADNMALATLGLRADVLAGVVLSEAHVLIKPDCGAVAIPLDYLPDPTQPLTVTNLGGTVTYVNGVDYFIKNGSLFVPPDSSIPDSLAPLYAPVMEVNYTRRPQQQIQGAMLPSGFFALQFAGFEVGSGQVDGFLAGVRYAKIKPSNIKLIGDDFQEIDMEFDLLPDPALGGIANLSPYFWGFFGATNCGTPAS